jgi:HlyD family secretion protein
MKKIIIYTSAVLTAILLAGFFFFKKNEAVIEIKTTKIKAGEINKVITATGTIEPLMKVQIGTQVSGVIEKIYVDYNSPVKANQVLAELDKTNLKAALLESNAILQTAQNELDYQQKNYDRIKKLHDGKVVSDTDYEEALYKLTNAKATVEQRKSDVSRAKTNLSYASIYSPIDGIIISRAIDVGQTVAASFSTPTLFTIAQNLKQMQVEVNVDEADIGQVEVGQHVVFTVDAYPDDKFVGTVTQVRLEPVEESNVITYTVIVKADNPEGKLMPGLTASVEIFTLQLKNIKTVEAKVLNFQPEPEMLADYNKKTTTESNTASVNSSESLKPAVNPTLQNNKTNEVKIVWIKKANNIQPAQVKIGASDGVSVEIIEGLNEGDEVVYAMTKTSGKNSGPPGGAEGSSPFMPKPPGKKN